MGKLIILANLGRIRSVRFKKGGETPREKDHLVEDAGRAVEEGVETIGEVVTDQAGRFSRNAQPGMEGGMSYGEQHNLESELERKALRAVAARVAAIVAEEGHPSWILVAPRTILPRLEAELPKACRQSLCDTLGADLTKEPVAKLEERFMAT